MNWYFPTYYGSIDFLFNKRGPSYGAYPIYTGYIERSRSTASIFFCPSVKGNRYGSPTRSGYDCIGYIATGTHYGGYIYTAYQFRNVYASGAWPSWSTTGRYTMDLAKNADRAFIMDCWSAGGLERYCQHLSGWNVWYLDGHVKFAPLNMVDGVAPYGTNLGLDYGRYFDRADAYK